MAVLVNSGEKRVLYAKEYLVDLSDWENGIAESVVILGIVS